MARRDPRPFRLSAASRTRRTAALALALGTVLVIAPACAQDPAAIGSGGDPAFVGGGGMPARASAPADINSLTGGMQQQDSVKEAEMLLREVRGQLSGTRVAETRDADGIGAVQYRNQAESLIRKHWDTLGPVTRDLYTSNYDRTDPNDPSQRYRSPYGDGGQIESKLLGGAQDARDAMQGLEDLLLPLIRDLKQGVDNGLQQRSFRR